ncbi:glutamate synthase-related protein [Sulfobacillus thermosulfidooxidans]|uniref:glutamate synthase-related protein n=1 Tax=Sulfobacillus thermosulfidooxidans TaxID=28034 RepID=UPI0006B55C30|nr:glutamate synthase-related protein [Sulfobacillus thermosulfidooxidans]
MNSRSFSLLKHIGIEHDACAIYAAIAKEPVTLQQTERLWRVGIDSLRQMDHRAGWIDGRSDGTGLLVDIPRDLWQQRLKEHGVSAYSAHDPRFWILQLVIPISSRRESLQTLNQLLPTLNFRRLVSHIDLTDSVQILDSHALWYEGNLHETENIFAALEALELRFGGLIASFSNSHIVLKVTEGPDALEPLLAEQLGSHFQPRAVIGHNRFSTNTATDLSRVQPFLGLAHNGEIDTIDRLQHEMAAHGIKPIPQGSDSQNLDRLLSALVLRDKLGHAEAVRVAISPSPAVIEQLSPSLQALWRQIRAVWGPYAQGPAAIVHRLGNSIVAAVDAMGLRPLWVLETQEYFILSSEPGITSPDSWIKEPRVLGPGQMVAFEWTEDGPVHVIENDTVMARLANKLTGEAPQIWEASRRGHVGHSYSTGIYRANGWNKDDEQLIKTFAEGHREPIGSLGFDGPLAPFSETPVNISDYLQETVAVVTNPALDREREAEHFSLTTLLGARPQWQNVKAVVPQPVLLTSPWVNDEDIEHLTEYFGSHITVLKLAMTPFQEEIQVVNQLAQEAVSVVKTGTSVLILDDRESFGENSAGLDPTLAVGAIDAALIHHGLRRQCSIIVCSGMIRNLHDSAVLLGLGANALNPYLIWDIAADQYEAVKTVMNHGLEKIISTMGIHELQGYGRVFSAIGLPEPIAELLQIKTFAPAPYQSWLEHRNQQLAARLSYRDEATRLLPIPRATNHVFKAVKKLANRSMTAREYEDQLRHVETKYPIALRQTLTFDATHSLNEDAPVSLEVGDHSLPFVISSMSFGSQGETAFRAYAEAGKRLNMLSMNGEGGEIPDMIGRYYYWRGHQIASGRFGVNTNLLNGARYAEIKIGQGAKPGEGGHLPGKKVSVKVAHARNAVPGVDLISPSNNHDLYSIEDLKELIDELKEANPELLVSVKVPVVPNIGTIAVGIVKAGADVISLSGFEGGTGAARVHALRHVGLPADIGVPLTHAALTLAGLRDRVEIWADGGLRSAADVVRMILLGANRVGFGTLSMMALGCTICRGCQLDTCHVGITTQIESLEEAQEKGLKRFIPQDFESAVEGLVNVFNGLAEGVRMHLRTLGFTSIQQAVGQMHLLRQTSWQDLVGYETFLNELNDLIQQDELVAEGNQAVGIVAKSDLRRSSMRLRNSRSIGTNVSGQRIRYKDIKTPILNPVERVAGQGFGAFLSQGVHLIAHGGAQDGVGKGASGGLIAVVKAPNAQGRYYGGHVGKSMAYGAQAGIFIVQGGADARAGIRLAGADVVILGDGIPTPKAAASSWDSAVIKGFGFEYMTRGRGLILGDPGPWLASGMTGGVIYLLHQPEEGLTRTYLESRLARSAKVAIVPINDHDVHDINELLEPALRVLVTTNQHQMVARLRDILAQALTRFLKIVPASEQMDPSISTE